MVLRRAECRSAERGIDRQHLAGAESISAMPGILKFSFPLNQPRDIRALIVGTLDAFRAPDGQRGESQRRGSLILRSTPMFAISVGIKPIEQRAQAGASERNGAVRSSAVNIDRIAIGVHRVSTREHDIVNVAVAFVVGLWAKDPRIASQQAFVRAFKIEQRQAQPIETA
jgi:hypothetical protein